ncbi:hypothetical protein [Haloferula sp. BvORR071]|uniref:hypothetical protein n=1 Tax=Haloferula sp. BvORR071 TaxID=1396141 RepID=UPI00054D3DD1|nr:hypothetical protein [Haloferula sp. BvORR071]
MSLPYRTGSPLPPPPPSRKSGCLRVGIWLLPSVILPMCLFGAGQLTNSTLGLYVGGAIGLGLTIYLGHFNAMLRCQQLGIPQNHPKAAIGSHVFIFVIVQVLVVPALWFALAWGACVLMGGGHY